MLQTTQDSPINSLGISMSTWLGLQKRQTGIPTTEYIRLTRQDADDSTRLDSDAPVLCVKPVGENR